MNDSIGVDDLVEAQRLRLKDAESLEQIAKRNPDLISRFADMIGGRSVPAIPPGKALATAIFSYLANRRSPAARSVIAKETGITPEAVRSVLLANQNQLFVTAVDELHPKRELWAHVTGASPDSAVDSPAYHRKGSKMPGPTEAVVAYLRAHPNGATLRTLVAALANKIRTDSHHPEHLIQSTAMQLVRTGKAVTVQKKGSRAKMYKLRTGRNGYKGNHKQKR